MTDEITDELVEAIWREARRDSLIAPVKLTKGSPVETAIRLAASGWRPTDPDLILARESVATRYEELKWGAEAARNARSGKLDDGDPVQPALRAIKAVRKQMEGGQ